MKFEIYALGLTLSLSSSLTPSLPGTITSLQSAAESHPTLQFSLYYDIQRRVLAVHVQQAYNLPVVSRGATTTTQPCSPFIVLFLLPNKEQVFESRVVHKDMNPFFNQIFDFPGLLPEDIRKQTLIMKVFHSRRTKPELIGETVNYLFFLKKLLEEHFTNHRTIIYTYYFPYTIYIYIIMDNI